MNESELLQAYLQTHYRFAEFTPTIGDPNPIDSPWIFLTAYNPRSLAIEPPENEQRDEKLHAWILGSGHSFLPALAVEPEGRWPAEPGWVILELSQRRAMRLGLQFGQNAIVAAERTLGLLCISGSMARTHENLG